MISHVVVCLKKLFSEGFEVTISRFSGRKKKYCGCRKRDETQVIPTFFFFKNKSGGELEWLTVLYSLCNAYTQASNRHVYGTNVA